MAVSFLEIPNRDAFAAIRGYGYQVDHKSTSTTFSSPSMLTAYHPTHPQGNVLRSSPPICASETFMPQYAHYYRVRAL